MENGTTCAECGAAASRMYCSTRCNNRAGERRRRARRLAERYPQGRPPCPACKAEIPDDAKLDAKWCSVRCRESVRVADRRAARHVAMFGARGRRCGECSAPLTVEHDGHVKFCSPRCQQRSNSRRWWQRNRPDGLQPVQLAAKLCGRCGALFMPDSARALYCSQECGRRESVERVAAAWRQSQEEILAGRTCAFCDGSMSHVTTTAARFCSARCRQRATYQRTQARHKAYRDKVRSRPEFREINRGYAHRRRARQVRTLLAEITPDLLAGRMSMFAGCWMCGGEWSEVEHVKPLAKGGPHILANLRPACGPCNRRKARTWEGVTWAMSLRAEASSAG